MTALRFGGYVWERAPDTVTVEAARNLRRLKLPFAGEAVQDLGQNMRTVTGRGRFLGADAAAQFNRLSEVFRGGGTALLHLEGVPPFPAHPLSLALDGQARADCVPYVFQMVEDSVQAGDDGILTEREYHCAGGETLWDVAARYGSTVDALLARNSWVKSPDNLEAGKVVRLV